MSKEQVNDFSSLCNKIIKLELKGMIRRVEEGTKKRTGRITNFQKEESWELRKEGISVELFWKSEVKRKNIE